MEQNYVSETDSVLAGEEILNLSIQAFTVMKMAVFRDIRGAW
jgi:hypothetical protein